MPDQAARPVAIVTGSATGIGAACARRLAEEGFNVVINYTTSEAEAQQTAAECQRTGVETLVVRANVADNGDCRRLAAAAVDAWGRLDVLVNNAGITRFARPDNLEKLTPADFADIFAVNVTGAWLMTRAAHPHLKASPVAAIVNVSSHSGISGIGSSVPYCASKGALNTMTLSLARAFAPAVRVNAVCPGFVDTRWYRGALDPERFEAFRSRIRDNAPLQRVVQPEEVADAVAWLACKATAITGHLLVIDGGTHLRSADPT